jgi:hypothetical protein
MRQLSCMKPYIYIYIYVNINITKLRSATEIYIEGGGGGGMVYGISNSTISANALKFDHAIRRAIPKSLNLWN